MPSVATEQQNKWRSKVESWIADNWDLPKGMNVKEVYNEVLYNSDIVTLSSLVNGVPNSLIDAYIPVADTIDVSLLGK